MRKERNTTAAYRYTSCSAVDIFQIFGWDEGDEICAALVQRFASRFANRLQVVLQVVPVAKFRVFAYIEKHLLLMIHKGPIISQITTENRIAFS